MSKFFAINLPEHLERLLFIIEFRYISHEQMFRFMLVLLTTETSDIRLIVVTFGLICFSVLFKLLLNGRHMVAWHMRVSSSLEGIGDNLLL